MTRQIKMFVIKFSTKYLLTSIRNGKEFDRKNRSEGSGANSRDFRPIPVKSLNLQFRT